MLSHPSAEIGMPLVALIVDADEGTRELYRQFLVPRRYIVETAADGHAALRQAISSAPDVIVTETRLAGIDGLTLCTILRADRDMKAVPIVVLTSDTEPVHLDRARQAGADAVLTKPCLPETLFSEMRQARERSRALRARSSTACELAEARRAEAINLMARSASLSIWRTHERSAAALAVRPPHPFRCPSCDAALAFAAAPAAGGNDTAIELLAALECPNGCVARG